MSDDTINVDPQRLGEIMRRAEAMWKQAERAGEGRLAKAILHAVQQLSHGNPAFLRAIMRLRRMPVCIDEFVESNDFLGKQIEVWSGLRESIRQINGDLMLGQEPVYEAILGGATGTGKTVRATVTNLYQLYVLLCFRDPQLMFGLSKATPIVFMFSSVSMSVTKRVIYKPFRDMFLGMPFAQKYVHHDRLVTSQLNLENNIQVIPALASVQSMVGQAVIGGILDEVNFMARVEESKAVPGPAGGGGLYDQAEETYRNLSRRRRSRFTTRGPSPGTICVVSSTRYKGDFLDRRIDQVLEHGEKYTLAFREKQYEVVPQSRFAGERFDLLVGTDSYPTRVLPKNHEAGRDYPEGAQIESIPVEYRTEFLKDPDAALRDIVGIATGAITPFIPRRDKIVAAMQKSAELGLIPWVDNSEVKLSEGGYPQIVEAHLPKDRARPRWMHVDLATSSDRCAFAVVSCLGYVARTVAEGVVQQLPLIAVELACSIEPDSLHQIDIGDVRQWITQLVTYWNVNVVQVSYDGFQSKESQQTLRKAGVRAKEISVDRTMDPYMTLRSLIYDDRLVLPDQDILRTELGTLEENRKKKKVDHPPRGSKDVADAVCGAVYAAVNSPLIRAHAVTVNEDGDRLVNEQTAQRREGVNRQRRPATRRK